MTLPPDFNQKLLEKSDVELYDMLAHEVDYLPEAIEFARVELDRRNLPTERQSALVTATEAK